MSKLLTQMREHLRMKNYSYRTEETYIGWVVRYIRFHKTQHPKDLTAKDVEDFLTHLAKNNVAPSTQNQAFSAILYLYKNILGIELTAIHALRARERTRLPHVLSHDDALKVIGAMSGDTKLMTQLLYGSGLRLMECLRLRVKDIDFAHKKIIVREGKGDKDRATILPDALIPLLQDHLQHIKALHEYDAKVGNRVSLPNALDRKYKNAGREWGWFYLFPAPSLSTDPRTGERKRHHIHEINLQRAIKAAATTAKVQNVSPHVFRHSFATRVLEKAKNKIAALQQLKEWMGHSSIQTTQIYLHFIESDVASPLDD